MIAIIRMRMIMQPAVAKIQDMRGDNEQYCRNQQPGFILNKKLFKYQANKA